MFCNDKVMKTSSCSMVTGCVRSGCLSGVRLLLLVSGIRSGTTRSGLSLGGGGRDLHFELYVAWSLLQVEHLGGELRLVQFRVG